MSELVSSIPESLPEPDCQGPEGGCSPARELLSSFGNDMELTAELPPSWTLKNFQKQAKLALDEYLVAKDLDDAEQRARALLADCPSEADELAWILIRTALDRDERAERAVVTLLCRLHSAGVVDGPALVRSYEKLFCTWEDVAIDTPRCPSALLGMLEGCIQAGIVDKHLLTKLPEALVKAVLSNAKAPMADKLKTLVEQLREFKRKILIVLEEYFVSLDPVGMGALLLEMDRAHYHFEFVKKAITLSFTQQSSTSAREAVMLLLKKLVADGVISKDDLQWGVTRLLAQLDDLAIDCPRCADLTTEVLSSMVTEELVSVPFLRRCRLLRIGGVTSLRLVDAVLRRTPEYSKRHLGTAHFKRELQTMVLEYFNSADEAEFCRCVTELAPLSPEQSAELVRKVMVLAMERSGSECEQALVLLVRLWRDQELHEDAIECGFDEMYTRMGDLELDVPDARDMARSFVVEAKKAGVLRDTWEEPRSQ